MDSNDKALGQSEPTVQETDVATSEGVDTVESVDVAEEPAAPEAAEVSASDEALTEEETSSPDEEASPEAESETEPETEIETGPDDTIEEEGLSDEELFLAALDGEMPSDVILPPTLRRGQIVKGVIASKTATEILIDVGVKSEGVVTGRELDSLDRETIDSLSVGDQVYVYVLTPEDREGRVLLSLRRAMEEQDWQVAEEYLESGKIYHSRIEHYNKGGLIVRFGKVRGFVPASQVSRERQRRSDGKTPDERWAHMVGEEIDVKVIEVDRGRNRLILSERAAERELRAQRRTELIESLSVGQVLTGRVISLTDFGAFVDLGGADGLIHLSELAWEHVTHPREVLSVGDEVEVEVIHIDKEQQRIGLSRKNRLSDPWDTLAATYEPDQLVQGVITKMTKFGAFARLVDHPAIEGLIHISELSDRRVKHPREVVEEGQVLTLRIIRIDPEQRRLGLSLKRVDSEEYLDADWRSMLQELNKEPAAAVDDSAPSEAAEEPVAEEEAASEEPATEEPSSEVPAEEAAPEGPVAEAPAEEEPAAEETVEAPADEASTEEEPEQEEEVASPAEEAEAPDEE